MKPCFFLLLAATLCVGCNRSGTNVAMSTVPGGSTATTQTPTAAGGTIIEFECSPIRVDKGKTATVSLTAKRKDPNAAAPKPTSKEAVMYKETFFQGPIQVEFDGSDAGLKIAPVVIPAGQEKAEATVTANADAAGGFVEITGKAEGKVDGVAPVTIRVRADVR